VDWNEEERLALEMFQEAGVDVYFYPEDLK